MEKAFIEFIKSHKLFDKNSRVLLALSGGVDSMVVLDLLLKLPPDLKPHIYLAHFNHKLRQASEEEEAYLKDYAKSLDLPLSVGHWEDPYKEEWDVENQARQARYRFFEEIIKETQPNLTHLITGHHADDQGETIIMKLIRGGLVEDKVGIEAKSRRGFYHLIRPILFAEKKQIYTYAKVNQLTYFEDQTNQGNAYLRNRIRHYVIPQLKEENPKTLTHLQDFSDDLADLLDIAEEKVVHLKPSLVTKNDKALSINLGQLKKESASFQRVFLKSILKEFFKDHVAFKKKHITQLYQLVNSPTPNQELHLSNHILAIKSYNDLSLIPKRLVEKPDSNKELIIGEGDMNQWFSLSPKETFGVFEKEKVTIEEGDQFIYTNPTDTHFPLLVRHRKDGDRISVKGMEGRKKLKDLFIDRKVPIMERDQAWVLSDQEDILWVLGYQESKLSTVKSTDKIDYICIYRKELD